MTALRFTALPPRLVEQARRTATAAGAAVEQAADDELYPVRCCLSRVPGEEGVVLLSARPPSADSPYAAAGPVYVHTHACGGYRAEGELPQMLRGSTLSVRGYDAAHMITGTAVVPADRFELTAVAMLADPGTAYLFVHYAGPGCYACRVDRADNGS